MRYALVLAVVAVALGYYFRDDIAPGWLGPDSGTRVNLPSGAGSINRSVEGVFGGAVERF